MKSSKLIVSLFCLGSFSAYAQDSSSSEEAAVDEYGYESNEKVNESVDEVEGNEVVNDLADDVEGNDVVVGVKVDKLSPQMIDLLKNAKPKSEAIQKLRARLTLFEDSSVYKHLGINEDKRASLSESMKTTNETPAPVTLDNN